MSLGPEVYLKYLQVLSLAIESPVLQEFTDSIG